MEILPCALRALDRLCRKAGVLETGGILIGRYSSDLKRAIVTDATQQPPESRAGRWWFVRGAVGLGELLRKRWNARHRTHYLGEWHFHPSSTINPSEEDIAQMIEISRAKDYECREPLLIIMGAGSVG